MPITITRTGELNPQYKPLTPEQRELAWAHIIRTWADKNAESFRKILETDADKQPNQCL